MRINGRIVFSLVLIVVAIGAIVMAHEWPFKAAFFPRVTAIPLAILAAIQLVVELFAKPRSGEEGSGGRHDLAFAAEIPPAIARRRTIAIFAWIGGFILLVFLLGFPYAIPLFVFAYLAPQRERWWLKVALPVMAWGVFYGLFVRLLHLPFDAGQIQTWLGWG